jgi:hypothetical protein
VDQLDGKRPGERPNFHQEIDRLRYRSHGL